MKVAKVVLLVVIALALLVPAAGAGGSKVMRGAGCWVVDAAENHYWDPVCRTQLVPTKNGYNAVAQGELPPGAALPKFTRRLPVTALGYVGCWSAGDGCRSVLTPSGQVTYIAKYRP